MRPGGPSALELARSLTVTRTRLAAAALAATCAVAAAAPAAQAASVITISGSTSVYPLTIALGTKYKKSHKKAKFRVFQGGSDIGINDVAKGRVSIGASSRDLLSGDPGGLQFNRIARDGVCVVTNPANRIANFSQEDVQNIFSGRIRRWDDVKGATVTGPINLDVRNQASGTQDAFRNIFMGPSLNVAPSASQKSSNGLVQQAVRSDRSAVGYVDLNFTGGVNPVPYKGIACNLRNAKAGQYPGLRNFWYVTRGKPKGAAKKFIKWVQTSSAARKVVSKHWVPLH
jgi:phosphate transport system substrate-binding protein